MMHDETFEQTEISEDVLEEGPRRFLVDGISVEVRTFQGVPLSAELPKEVELTVKSELSSFGGTGPATKLVALDNGAEVKTPSYVVAGDKIFVKTADGSFVRRA